MNRNFQMRIESDCCDKASTSARPPEPIIATERALETCLARLSHDGYDQEAGLFGPSSLTWRINRESAIFLGAGRALLLQIAHPWVAQAIADHSPVKGDPLGRFYRTMPPVFAMVFGTRDQAFAQARAIHRIHRRIRGTLREAIGAFPKGSTYRADEAHAALWVFATLWDTSLLCYEHIISPLPAAQRNQYWTEGKRLAALFGIPDRLLPENVSALEDYMEGMVTSGVLAVGTAGRDIADFFFGTGEKAFGRFLPGWSRILTAHLLPSGLREPCGLTYGPRERESAERTLSFAAAAYRSLPRRLRFVGPYQEALARIEGKSPDLLTRALNKVWLGQTRLPPTPG